MAALQMGQAKPDRFLHYFRDFDASWPPQEPRRDSLRWPREFVIGGVIRKFTAPWADSDAEKSADSAQLYKKASVPGPLYDVWVTGARLAGLG